MKVGDRVRILCGGGHTYLVGRTGTIVRNDFDKYDFKVKVDGHIEFYFFKEDLLPLDAAQPVGGIQKGRKAVERD